MTKDELIHELQSNELPGDTEVVVSTKKYNNGESRWDKIKSVDKTPPIIIVIGETVMA